jgi:hypothetical protein
MIRELKPHDKIYFEKLFFYDITRFIQTLSSGLRISDDNFDLLLDLTNEDFYEDMKSLEYDNPSRLNKVLTAHYVTEFLLAVLQFTFAFFVKGTSSVGQKEKQKEKRVYDHRKPLEADFDLRDTAFVHTEHLVQSFGAVSKQIAESLGQIW